MAKQKFETLGDLSDLGQEISIAFDRVPDTMNAKMQKATNDIIKAALCQIGFKGHWRLNSIRRSPDFQRDMPVFTAKSLCEVRGGKQNRGIKIVVKALRDRKSCFEAVLVPPDDLDAVDVFQSLTGGPGEGKSGGMPVIQEAKEGEIYVGRVASLTNYGAFVTIFPGNPPRMQEALCHITEISHNFLQKPEQELRRGQLVRVICTGFNDDGKAKLSRKELLPVKDDFKGQPENGVLSMHGFCTSEERIAFALNIFRESVEQHSSKLAWARAQDQGVEGGVFLEGEGVAFAPACFVLEDLKEGIQRQWKAKKLTKLSGLIRYLVSHCYIWVSTDRDGENSVGYAMTDEGYAFLRIASPPLPEYYEPPAVRKTNRTTPEDENVPLTMSTPEAAAFDLSKLGETLDRIEEYERKSSRLDEINERLKAYDDLVAERQEISEWLEQHSDVPAQAKLAEQIHARLATRFDKPQQ